MVALWYRASQYLGPIWESQFGGVNDDTIYAWQEALRTLSEAQIAVGVEALSKWTAKYPPTLGQFRELCKVGPQPTPPQLEHHVDRERAKQVGDRELRKMKALLGKVDRMAKENPPSDEELDAALKERFGP
jgi:hypothetical protein